MKFLKSPNEEDYLIFGRTLREERLRRNQSIDDVLSSLPLSARQITELEEGGSHSFYGFQAKLAACRRYAESLGMDLERVVIKLVDPEPLPHETVH